MFDHASVDSNWETVGEVDGEKVRRPGDGTFDELTVDGWLRIEQLEPGLYWLRVGDVRLTAEVGPNGAVTVNVQRGAYAPVRGTTTVHTARGGTGA